MVNTDEIYNFLASYCTRKRGKKKCKKYYSADYVVRGVNRQGITIEFFIDDKKYYVSMYYVITKKDTNIEYELTSPDRVRKINKTILFKKIKEKYNAKR